MYAAMILAALAAPVGNPGDTHDAYYWQELRRQANAFVDRESPASAFPIDVGPVRSGDKLVVALYMPSFPLSLDGKPFGQDYYTQQYLNPAGEHGKHAMQRGYLRMRPLPAPLGQPSIYKDLSASIEVARAKKIDIDAFGLGIEKPDLPSTIEASSRLLAAGEAAGLSIVPEPDMSALGDIDPAQLAGLLYIFAQSKASYRQADGRMLVMPFAAERRTPAFWVAVEAAMLSRGEPIALVPVFLNPSAMPSFKAVSSGASVWGSRDAASATTIADASRQAAGLGYRQWFATVSPQDYRPKAGLIQESRNTQAYRDEWMSVIKSDVKDVHIATWNDYSETTPISPSSITNFLFYDLTAYYIRYFKAGTAPTIRRDAIYYAYRPQIVSPSDPRRGPIQRVAGRTALSNDIEVVALCLAPSSLTIEINGAKTVNRLPAGFSVTKVLAEPGTPSFKLERNGTTIVDQKGPLPIDPSPERHDATYGGGSSLRAAAITRKPGLPGS